VAQWTCEVATSSTRLRRACQRFRDHTSVGLAVTEPERFATSSIKDLVVPSTTPEYGSRTSNVRFAIYLGDLARHPAGSRDSGQVPTPEPSAHGDAVGATPTQKQITLVWWGGGVGGWVGLWVARVVALGGGGWCVGGKKYMAVGVLPPWWVGVFCSASRRPSP